MKEERILRAMGEIDEKYVEEAALPKAEEVQVKKISPKKGRRWQKTVAGLVAALLIFALGAGASSVFDNMFRMGSSGYKSADEGYYYAGNGASYDDWDMVAESEAAYPADEPAYTSGATKGMNNPGASNGSEASNIATRGLKLIYRANVTVQAVDFEEAVNTLTDLVSANGGYFESSEVYNGNYGYSDTYYKSGYYVVRVPAEKYKAFLAAVGDSCYVSSISESVQDVGTQYFEIETRLKTLYTKEERLQTLLKQATGMSEIIEIENALSDTEYMIDLYTSDLNRYDSLIGYSTINVNIEKVSRPSGSIDEDDSFGARFLRALKRGAESFVNGLENLVLWFSYNIITIIVIVVIVIVCWRLHVIRRIRNLFRRKHE